MKTIHIDQINCNAKNSPGDFVKQCESDYSKIVSNISDEIGKSNRISPIILLTGPSSSGKTTTAKRIKENLKSRNIDAHLISLDDYYIDKTDEDVPRDEFGEVDLESPYCLDLDLLNKHMNDLYHGRVIEVPRYDFVLHKRTSSVGPLTLLPNEVVIFEGIHALNSMITGKIGEKAVKIYIEPQTTVELSTGRMLTPEMTRFMRRMVRDSNFRGARYEETMKMWSGVRRGEQLFIKPFVHNAQIIADTYLLYETCIFANILKKHLNKYRDILTHLKLQTIIEAVDEFSSIDYKKYLPDDSVLREFIG